MIPALLLALIIGGVVLIINGRAGGWMIALALLIAAIIGMRA